MKIIDAKIVENTPKKDAIIKISSNEERFKVVIKTAEANFWLRLSLFKSKGYTKLLGIYVGGQIEVEFYASGEIFGDLECNTEKTIIKDFVITANPEVLALIEEIKLSDE